MSKKIPRYWDKIVTEEILEDGTICKTLKSYTIPVITKEELKEILEKVRINYATPIYYNEERVLGISNWVTLDIYLDPTCWDDLGETLLHECLHLYYPLLSEYFIRYMESDLIKNDLSMLKLCQEKIRETIPENFDIDKCQEDFEKKWKKYKSKIPLIMGGCDENKNNNL